MSTLLAVALSCVVAVQTPQTGEPPKGTAKISGVVTRLDNKLPIEGVTIRAIRWDGGLGQQIPARATDANGRFTFEGLLAGSYALTFSADRFVSLQFGQLTPDETAKRIELKDALHFDKADISLPPTTAIEGRLLDEFGDPAPGIVVQPARVQFLAGKRRLMPIGAQPARPTDDRGRFRIFNLPPAEYYLLALAGPFAGPNDPSGFAVTYFPGTVVPMEAKPVRVELGQDVTGLVFQLTPAPMSTVSGVLLDESDKPLSGTMMFIPTSGDDVRSFLIGRIVSGQDGAFAFRNVAPGSYVIQAFGRGASGNLGSGNFVSLPLTVSAGTDVTDLKLKVAGATARGRILLEGDAPPPAPSRVLVSPSAINFVSSPVGGGPPSRITRDDWTFEVYNMSGLRMMRVIVGSGRWTMKQVTLNGRDITDEPIDFRKGDVNGLEITLTSLMPVLEGSVTDAGKPATECTLVVFSADPAKWAFPSRYFSQVRPDPKGWFQIGGLPPGDYLALALPTVQGTDWQDPEFLRQHIGVATRFSLAEGGKHTIALKVYRLPR